MPPHIQVNNISFEYSDSEFKAWGFTFEREPDFYDDKPIEYWKAQLAFRGYSPRGSILDALKRRLREVDMTEMDSTVRRRLGEWEQNVEMSRKRKAPESPDGDSEGENTDEEDNGRRSARLPASSATLVDSRPRNNPIHLTLEEKRQFLLQKRQEANGWLAEARIRCRNQGHDDKNEWNINGTFAIDCPELEDKHGRIIDRHGRPKPYVMEIFTSYMVTPGADMEIFGRFSWGLHRGIFRFCDTKRKTHGYYPNELSKGWHPYSFDARDEPSDRQPFWCYRWRGRRTKDDGDIIELGVDKSVCTMTFSEDGRRVLGTWGGEDIGVFDFTGQKTDDRNHSRMDIRKEWENVSAAAHGKENTARKRRR